MTNAQLILDMIFIIVFSCYLYWLWGLIRALKSDAPYVPMNAAALRSMITLAAANPHDVWYDLGSGNGRVLIAAVNRYGLRGVGIEQIRPLRIWSRLRIWLRGLASKITILPGDFFTIDVSKATIVSLYLLPTTHSRLSAKLLRELRPGTKVLWHRFALPGMPITDSDEEHAVYMSVIGN